MRIVVTGATGNIGTSLLEALAREAEVDAVVAIARRLPDVRPPGTARWVASDVAADDLAPLFAGADVVVHLAWLFQPTHDPVATWQTNVLGSIRVFEAAAEAGARALVVASSVGAYSPGPKAYPVDESWPTHALPTAPYGAEKSYVERVLDAFEAAHPSIRVVRMRPAFVFRTAAASEQWRLFAGTWIPRAVLRRGLLPVFPDIPELRFQAVHARDVADALRRAIVGDARGAFNLAAEPVLGPADIGRLLGARVVPVPSSLARAAVAAGWHARLIPVSPFLVDLAMSLPVMDTTRARTELGWRPRVDALAALVELVDGVQRGAGLPTPPMRPEAIDLRDLAASPRGAGERI